MKKSSIIILCIIGAVALILLVTGVGRSKTAEAPIDQQIQENIVELDISTDVVNPEPE